MNRFVCKNGTLLSQLNRDKLVTLIHAGVDDQCTNESLNDIVGLL